MKLIGVSVVHGNDECGQTGHISRESGGLLCGIDKRYRHLNIEESEEENLDKWIKMNEPFGVLCKKCLKSYRKHHADKK